MEYTIVSIVVLVIAVIGVAISWIFASKKVTEMRFKEVEKEKEANQKIAELNINLERTATELNSRDLQIEEKKKEKEILIKQNNELITQVNELTSQVKVLESQNKTLKEGADIRQKQQEEHFEEWLKTAQENLTNRTHALLEQNVSKLKDGNNENIGNITRPLQEQISELRKAINDNEKTSTEQHTKTWEQIKQMMERTVRIENSADNLANAIQKSNKVMGDMGEMLLEEIFVSIGMEKGIHYDLQPTLRGKDGKPITNDDTGKQMRPDAIVHFPKGQDIIIDSKVSLKAFEAYSNAENDEERERALKEHIESIKQHVKELKDKNYSGYIEKPRETVDFVVMFVPFDTSLQLALTRDANLWRDAFDKKVFITGGQCLFALLNLVQHAWIKNDQTKNLEQIMKGAETLVDRLGDFISRYDKLGEDLKKSVEQYELTKNKLYIGQQSVIGAGNKLVKLGVKENSNRPIPEPEPDIMLLGNEDLLLNDNEQKLIQ